MHIKPASVVGIPSKTSWASTAVLKFSEGEVLAAVAFSGDDSAPHEGRRFIRFLEDLAPSSGAELYNGVEQAIASFSANTAFSVALLWHTDGIATLLTYGFGLIGVAKSGAKPHWIITGDQERQVLEGEVHAGDTFVLGTSRAREVTSTFSMLPISSGEDAASELFSPVQKHVNSGEIALLFARMESGEALASEPEDLVVESDSSGHQITEDPEISDAPPLLSKTPHSDDSFGVEKSVGAQNFLINPDKLAAGVRAAEDVPAAAKRKLPKISLPSISFRALHAARIAIAVGLVVVAIAVLFGYRTYSVQREYKTVIIPIEELAKQVKSFGPNDRFAQRSAAESLLERIGATRLSYSANKRKLTALQDEISEIHEQVSGKKEVVNLPVFYDFRLVSADFLATKSVREKDWALFLDANKKRAIRVNLGSKQNETIPFDNAADARDLAQVGERLFVLGSTDVYETSITGANLKTASDLSGVEDPILAEGFGDALYVLDRGEQQIWKLAVGEDGASPSAWVRSARGIDFSTVGSMSVDGTIWIGTNTGEIFNLVRGERQNFSLVGVPEPFTSSVLLSTTPEGKRLAIVEPAQKRLVIVDKATGEYQSEIDSEQLGAVTDVILSDDESKVYLLAGSVVYMVEI